MVTITLVDDTDLSKPGSGQQARTYALFSNIAKYAKVKLILQKLEDPKKVPWAYDIKLVKCMPGKLSSLFCGVTALKDIVSFAKDSDVIIAEHIYGVNRLAPIASKLLQIPFIYDSHGNEIETCTSIRCFIFIFPFEKYMYKSADLIFTISDNVAKNTLKFYGLSAEKVFPLPPALRPISCSGEARNKMRGVLRRWGVKDEENIVVMHGSLDYGPNADALRLVLKLSDGMRKKYNTIIVVAGSSKVMRPGWITKDVLYIGYVENIDELLCTADASIAPLVSGTGISMKVLDYLSAGLPLIATPYALRGIPINSLVNYPIKIIDTKTNLGEAINQLLMKARGPFSGKANLPTYEELAKIILKIIYDKIGKYDNKNY